MTWGGHAASAAKAALPAAPLAELGGTTGGVLAQASTLAHASSAEARHASVESALGGIRPGGTGASRRHSCGPRIRVLETAAQATCAPSIRIWAVRVAC
eukprot:15370288-Alexandrium_andersonii.AAC.1